MIRLRGMTWRHDRGLAPMVATAKEFARVGIVPRSPNARDLGHPDFRGASIHPKSPSARDLGHPDFQDAIVNPEVAIEWEARSLSEFGEAHADKLAEQYDLVVLDHPYVGALAASGAFLALDEHLPAEYLRRLAADSTGPSYTSYEMQGHVWALAIDAAAQVTGYRADLLEREGVPVPQSWEDVLAMGRVRRGFASMPLLPLDAYLALCSICANAGEAPFSRAGGFVSRETAEYGLEMLCRLRDCSVEQAMRENPIAVWERMSSTDETAYCPLAFGYSNYARAGYREHRITFGAIPSGGHGPVGATLGGAGLSISARCAHRDVALEYAARVASPECQGGLYVDAGGQPGSRAAWTSEHANAITCGYFRATLPVLEHAWLRPRDEAFPARQARSAEIVARFLEGKISRGEAAEELGLTRE